MSLKKALIAFAKVELAVLVLIVVPQILFVAWHVVRDPDAFRPKAQFTLSFSAVGRNLTFPLHTRTDPMRTGLLRLDCDALLPTDTSTGQGIMTSRCTAKPARVRKVQLKALFSKKNGWVHAGPWPEVRERVDFARLVPPWWLSIPSLLLAFWLLRDHSWRGDAAGIGARPARSLGFLVMPWLAVALVGGIGGLLRAKPEEMMVGLQSTLATGSQWTLVIALVLVAPLLEELIFRGLGWKYLRPDLGALGTIAVSCLSFTFLHAGQYDLFGLAMILAMALSLSWIRERASLLLCIGAHALSNGLAVVAMLHAGR